ncbi:protein lin-37 homolog [Macrosteles quadrilineatus]|uniref:protein lin-37 homolog n=1 Tax=Macrosteles quadrilineatus TaxID=74068 RepID=UPI0023E2C6AF|nr:protein lin-37 homolog [Macrosteles quadrilineatus]
MIGKNKMAKKRRLLGTPSPSSSKARFDSRSSGDDVTVARAHLKETLHDILHADDDSSSSQDDNTAKAQAVPIKKEPKPLVRRRKRKSGADVELAFHHHTFVMKLFDRSVDLAQFKEDTPLYPICRAWIRNQPRIPLPIPTIESTEIKREEEFNNYQLELQGLRDVHKFPAPSCPAWLDRIPTVNIPPLQGVNLDYSSDDLPTAEELLKGHLSRWGNVRKKWIEAAQLNEARFATSAKILSNMFKRSQNL